MNKILTLLSILIITTVQLSAQLIEVDIKDRNESAYLSLQNIDITYVNNNNWDISFMTGLNAGISINGGQGVRLWHVTDGANEDFDMALDTTGKFDVWVEQLNSQDSWSIGAFNLGVDGFAESTGDFGWGQYNQTVITGTELYVIKLRNGDYKKITIDELAAGIYYFSYSDLNNENKMKAEISKANFSGKMKGYYDLEKGEQLDREPVIGNWDLEFSRYLELVTQQGATQPYPVVGIRNNSNIKVAQLDEVDVVDTPLPDDTDFSSSITAIGYDWKEFDFSLGYVMAENRVYFVQKFETVDNGNGPEESPVGELHKLVFTGFEGGKFTINGKISSVSQSDYDNSKFAVYPNVIAKNDKLNLVYAGNDLGNATLNIYSATGQNVHTQSVVLTEKLQISNISTTNFDTGIYFVKIQNGNSSYTQKFIVR